jgi:predicted neutral ceramidase superfamily lipid hydrolase
MVLLVFTVLLAVVTIALFIWCIHCPQKKRTIFLNVVLHLLIWVICFYIGACYYSPGNPRRPSNLLIDVMFLLATADVFVQMFILFPLGIFLNLKRKGVLLRRLVLVNLGASSFAVALVLYELATVPLGTC